MWTFIVSWRDVHQLVTPGLLFVMSYIVHNTTLVRKQPEQESARKSLTMKSISFVCVIICELRLSFSHISKTKGLMSLTDSHTALMPPI